MSWKRSGWLLLCVVGAVAVAACEASDPRYTAGDQALAQSVGDELLRDDVDDAAQAVLGDVLPQGEVFWWLPIEEEYAENDKAVVDVSAPADIDAEVHLRLRVEAVGTQSDTHASTADVMSDDPVYVSSIDVWLHDDERSAEDSFLAPSITFPEGLDRSAVDRRCVAHHSEVVDQYSTGVYARGVASNVMIEIGVASARDEQEAGQVNAAETHACDLLDRVLAVDGVG